MLAIALATFKEALRKKVIILVSILTIIYLAVFAVFSYFMINDLRSQGAGSMAIITNAAGIVSILGFYFSSMIVAFVTIMASTGAISSDIESGVIYSVITKPIRRTEYVLGKIIGLSILSAGYAAVIYTALVFINIILEIPPICSAGLPVLLEGLAFFIFEPLVIMPLCVFGSVFLKTMSNDILVIGVYIMGMIAGMMEQVSAVIGLESLKEWGIFLSLLSPFDSIYRRMISTVYSSINIMGSKLAGPFFMSDSVPSDWMMIYAAVFSVIFTFLALKKFNRKDINYS